MLKSKKYYEREGVYEIKEYTATQRFMLYNNNLQTNQQI